MSGFLQLASGLLPHVGAAPLGTGNMAIVLCLWNPSLLVALLGGEGVTALLWWCTFVVGKAACTASTANPVPFRLIRYSERAYYEQAEH